MAQPVARIGDMCVCVCKCHRRRRKATVGFFVTGDFSVSANGRPIARVGDIAMCTCGHPTFAVMFTPTVSAHGRGIHRQGDAVVGCPIGITVTGSPNVTAS